jgi:hypothetical protein
MDDQDVMTHVRGSLANLQMTASADSILRQGDSLRVKRHRRTAIGGIGLAAVAVVGGTVAIADAQSHAPHRSNSLTSGVHQTQPPAVGNVSPRVTLAAWTVKTRQDGTVRVTVRQMKDVPGLEASLRSAGVSAVVTSSLSTPPGCAEWHDGNFKIGDVVTTANKSGLPGPDGLELIVHPTDVPNGALLWLGLAQAGAPAGSTGPSGPMAVGFLNDTSTCRSA